MYCNLHCIEVIECTYVCMYIYEGSDAPNVDSQDYTVRKSGSVLYTYMQIHIWNQPTKVRGNSIQKCLDSYYKLPS